MLLRKKQVRLYSDKQRESGRTWIRVEHSTTIDGWFTQESSYSVTTRMDATNSVHPYKKGGGKERQESTRAEGVLQVS